MNDGQTDGATAGDEGNGGTGGSTAGGGSTGREDGGETADREGDGGAGGWVSLFSGGKDSSFALHRALESGRDVRRLLTVHPEGDSYMYHVPATRLARLAAESIGIELVEVEPAAFETGEDDHDSTARGDAEVEPMEAALSELSGDLEGGLAGVTAGAVESEYQTGRIRAMCDRLEAALFAPLWQRDPWTLADEMLAAGFEIRIVRVAAAGLDESWLGRPLDREALADLRDLNAEYGVHPLGEGGEFETLVVDGPHMDRRLDLSFDTRWEGTRGTIAVTDARLA